MHNHTSLSVWITVARAVLLDAGHDADAILQKVGVDLDALNNQQCDRFDIKVIGDVWRKVSVLTADPAIGLRMADQYFQPAHWQALGLSVLCSSSLYDAFNRLVRYNDVITDAAIFSIKETDQGVDLIVDMRDELHIIGDEAIDFGFVSLMTLFRMIYPDKLSPSLLISQRASQDGIEQAYKDYFGCEVVFSAACSAFRFSADVAHKKLPMGNDELAAYQDRLSEDYKKRFGNDSLAIKVKDEMMRQLPGGEPTPKAVASALLLSVRNLQRKLNNEGTSFSALLTEIRMQLAEEYLQQSYRSCNEIAYLLGFSDHSNFTRAFRRWFGTTPTRYREQLPP